MRAAWPICWRRARCPEALAAYEANRLPATAAVVASNRVGGPERVIDLIASRAPRRFRSGRGYRNRSGTERYRAGLRSTRRVQRQRMKQGGIVREHLGNDEVGSFGHD